jgi:hypothetical protein
MIGLVFSASLETVVGASGVGTPSFNRPSAGPGSLHAVWSLIFPSLRVFNAATVWNFRLGTDAGRSTVGFESNAAGKQVHGYRTMNLSGIFVRKREQFMFPQNTGRLYHDGRFKTRFDVTNSYNERFNLGLINQEKHDIDEYLKSL